MLLHLVDGTGEHAGKAYKTVRAELEAYGGGLAEKPEIVALSKTDAVDPEYLKKQRERLMRAIRSAGPGTEEKPVKPLLLSAASGEGVNDALRALQRQIDARRADAEAMREAPAWRP